MQTTAGAESWRGRGARTWPGLGQGGVGVELGSSDPSPIPSLLCPTLAHPSVLLPPALLVPGGEPWVHIACQRLCQPSALTEDCHPRRGASLPGLSIATTSVYGGLMVCWYCLST